MTFFFKWVRHLIGTGKETEKSNSATLHIFKKPQAQVGTELYLELKSWFFRYVCC